MCSNSRFEFFIIIFALFLISETNGKIVPCNVSVESKVCFLVDDYVTTGIEKLLFFLEVVVMGKIPRVANSNQGYY